MRKVKYLFMLLPLLLSGCNSNLNMENNPNTPQTSFVYKALEEEPIVVDKEGVEIISIDVINIPEEGIKVGQWNLYGIEFLATYSDGTTRGFPFLEKHLPISTRHYLGEIGHHTLTLLIHNQETTFGFDVIRNEEFNGYTCQFVNSYDNEVVYTTTVGYYQNVEYLGPEIHNRDPQEETITKFVGWDYPLEYIHQNMIFTTVFRDTEKRFYGDSINHDRENILSTYEDGDSVRALVYLGRVHGVAMNYSDTYHHKKGDEAKELHFNQLNPYSETWTNMNKEIIQYGVRYSFDNNTAQYLYGSNASLTSTPSFAADFDANYSVTSTSTMLDDGTLIDTSDLPAYKTAYEYAEDYVTHTLSVEPTADTGYYRLALVDSFDIYLSVGFRQLGFGKYYLEDYAQFVCSPVGAKKNLLLQYSEDGNFVNTFEKKIDFSNSTLLDVASRLQWGE